MKSLIYAANTSSQTVVAGGSVVNFGSIVRRYGCDCNLSGGNIEIGGGYFDVNVNLTFTSGGAGTETIQLYKNGVAVPGAEATVTVADATTYSVTIPSVVRQSCNCGTTLTVVAGGVAGSIVNAGIVVERA